MIAPEFFDDLMNQGWPALDQHAVDGWLVRLSAGITQRGNSTLPRSAPANVAGALDEVETLYRTAGVAPCFQIGPSPSPANLDLILAERGYQIHTPCLVQVVSVADALAALPATEVAVLVEDEPSQEWLDLWWSVDGRGDSGAAQTARRILTGGPALYASAIDSVGVTAVGRLALADKWAGVYCMAVRPDARRRGFAQALLRNMFEHASCLGVEHVWLQVLTENEPARALYEQIGFTTRSSYHYRTLALPPGPGR